MLKLVNEILGFPENSSMMNIPKVTKAGIVRLESFESEIAELLLSSLRRYLMQVWAILYHPASFSDDLYHRALGLVDTDSSVRIKKFFRREDACRTLIGRLLIRSLLHERGIHTNAMTFSVTEAGKPYITTPGLKPQIGYNISHDNALVAMAYAPGVHNSPVFNIGIDVMKVRIPGKETLASFIDTVGDQLTPLEKRILSGIPDDECLRRFFWIWTMKEAYTKAVGLGLGFDFSRVEFDVVTNVVRVDGAIPRGWRFSKFTLNDSKDLYEGVVAEFIGGSDTEVIHELSVHDWVICYDAVSFVEKAITDLADD